MRVLTANPAPRRVLAALFVLSIITSVVCLTYEHYLPGALVKLGVAAICAAAFAIAVVAYPKWGLFFGIFYVYAGLAFYFKLPVPLAVMALVLGSTSLRYFRGDTFQLTNSEFNWSLAVFALICVASITWAHAPELTLLSLSQFLKVVATTYLAVQLVRTPYDLRHMLAVIFWGALASVLLGMLNLHLGIDDRLTTVGPEIVGVVRFAGTHDNPNNAAIYMLSGVPLAVFLFKRSSQLWLKLAYLVGALVLVVALVLTFSRGALPPLALVLTATLLREARSRRAHVLMGLGLFVAVLLTPSYYWLRLASFGDLLSGALQDWSFYLRYLALKTSWLLFMKYPLFGVGLYNFNARCGNELFVPVGVHNTYMEVAVGVGIFGLLAYLAVHMSGILALVRSRRHAWRADLAWMEDLVFYVGLTYASVMCGALFQSIEFYQMMWLPIAAALVASRLRENPEFAALRKNSADSET